MLTSNLLGEEIFTCDKATAKRLWSERKAERHKLWLEEEACKALLLEPKELREIMKRKRLASGFVYRGTL